MVDGTDLEVGSAAQTIACDLERPVGAQKATRLATVDRQVAQNMQVTESAIRKNATDANDRCNVVVAAITQSNSLLKRNQLLIDKKTNIQLWISQRGYYMAVGNTEVVSFYDAKLKEAEDVDNSIPGSIPRTPPTPGAATAATPGETTATTSTEDDDEDEE
jgi:hypothetical protein